MMWILAEYIDSVDESIYWRAQDIALSESYLNIKEEITDYMEEDIIRNPAAHLATVKVEIIKSRGWNADCKADIAEIKADLQWEQDRIDELRSWWIHQTRSLEARSGPDEDLRGWLEILYGPQLQEPGPITPKKGTQGEGAPINGDANDKQNNGDH
ncbi:MAG: hypothetical protein M1821_005510 [Bathelium mastoideum]|nr:MAG: hypothetical protein M1821_005510 [Bathelium mastoideum]